MSTAEATERGKQLFRELDLDGLWERQPKTMSGGQRRRLDIAVGLIHVPELVFLDEPTTGLDPQARANLWQHIRGLREERGTTVFLTTHYLDEADALCDRILVIDHGAIVAERHARRAEVAGRRRRPHRDRRRAGPGRRRSPRLVGALPGAEAPAGRSTTGSSAGCRTAARRWSSSSAGWTGEGIAVSGIESRRPSLDDVFLQPDRPVAARRRVAGRRAGRRPPRR